MQARRMQEKQGKHGERAGLVLGVGIDMVCVSELKQLADRTRGAFIDKTYSEAEKLDAKSAQDVSVFYAGRFAIKEAVFKAVAHLTAEQAFDFRIVEARRMEDGRAILHKNDKMQAVLEDAGIDDVLLSLSSEGEFVIAIAEAIQYPETP